MKGISLVKAGFFGALIGGAAAGLSYLGNKISALPYIPFDIFDWMARVLPGRLLASTIDAMLAVIRGLQLGPTASTAKLAEQGLAILQFILAWTVFGIILGAAGRRRPKAASSLGPIGGAAGFIFALIVDLARGVKETGLPAVIIWLALVL